MVKNKAKTNFNPDRIKDRIESVDRATGYDHIEKNDDLKSYRMIEGDNFIRVLPAYDAEHDMALDIHVHYGVGGDKSSFLCLKKMKDEDCPICEQALKYQQAGKEEEAKRLRPARRTLFFILDREKEDEGVKLFEAPTASVGDPLISLCLNRRTRKIIDITDINVGYDVIIVRKGTGMTTKYKSVTLDQTPSKLDDESLLDDILPFENLLHYESYETMKAEFLGKATRKDEEKTNESEDDFPEIDTGETNDENKEDLSDQDDKENNDSCPEGFAFGEDYDDEEECADCEKETRKLCRKEHRAINKKFADKL